MLVTRRGLQIFGEVAWVLGSYPVRARAAHAELAQRSVARLGTVFIKMGQTLSTRPDIVPREYLVALAELQDRVPPFDTAIAHGQISTQLGLESTSDVFSSISADPVAAASLGQVYRATLRAPGGGDVALKVQRPGLRAQIGADALLMRTAAAVVQWTISFADALASLGAPRQAKRTDLVAFVDEIVDSLEREIDYELEADSCERFHALYCGAGCLVEGIAAPRVLRHLSGPEVLCLTWMEGERLADAAARERAAAARGGTRDSRGLSGAMVEQLLDRGVRFSLQSMLLDGFFHADPHPGNMLVVPRAGAGAARADDARHFDLVFLDFGMMGELPRTARIGLLGVVVHLWQLHDVALRAVVRVAAARELAEALSAIGFVAPNADLGALAAELEAEFAPGMGAAAGGGERSAGSAAGGGAGGGAGGAADAAEGNATFTFGDAAAPLLLVLGRIGRLPLWFPAVFRALVTLEGAAVAVDPSFEVMRRAMPAVAQILVVNRHSARSAEVSFLSFTVTCYANLANNLTRSP
jgi:predicted unusual protein kinase regulating ubiquinone biosynthesis (AarF/ABC1/UbiB family)